MSVTLVIVINQLANLAWGHHLIGPALKKGAVGMWMNGSSPSQVFPDMDVQH